MPFKLQVSQPEFTQKKSGRSLFGEFKNSSLQFQNTSCRMFQLMKGITVGTRTPGAGMRNMLDLIGLIVT